MSQKRIDLVNELKRQGYIQSEKVENAFLSIKREKFIPDRIQHLAYYDQPLDIGNNQTISAPHMVAIMCEAMNLSSGDKVLEIGTGSGYHAAIVSHIIGKSGHVYSVERFEELAKKAILQIKNEGIENVTVTVADGSLGLKDHSPYDCIYVTCSAPSVPDAYKNQIRVGGRIIIPIGRVYGELVIIIKNKNGFQKKSYGGCAFVPLIGKNGFKD